MVDITLVTDIDTGNGIVEIEVFYDHINKDMIKMAQLSALYQPIWEPKFKTARMNIKPIESGLNQLENKEMREEYDKRASRHGFGSWNILHRFTKNYLTFLKKHPKCKIKVINND